MNAISRAWLAAQAAASGGGAGAEQEQDLDKTENGRQQEPVLKGESPARCASVTGGGRYRCKYDAGHDGRHMASGVFNTWSDDA